MSNSETKAPIFTTKLPKGIRVLGRWKSTIGIGFIDQNSNEKTICHFSIAELAKACESLVTKLIDLGYAQFASGKALRDLKFAILERANPKLICIPSNVNGLQTIELNAITYTAYIWDQAIHWFGKSVASEALDKPVAPTGNSDRLQQWQSTMGQYCKKNPNLIVTICHALSAVLRQHHHRSFLVLMLVGPSSTGKTTIQMVVTGLRSNPDLRDAIPQFNGSEPGIRQYLSQHPGQCACFQDIQLSGDIRKTIKLIFGLADSSSRFLQAGPTEPLNCITIFSNERSIIEMAHCDHRDINDGLFARVFEIHSDAPYGMFHDIRDSDSPSEFAKHLHEIANQNAGAVWPAWIQAIADHWEEIEDWWEKRFPIVSKRLFEQVDPSSQLSTVDRRMVDELAYSAWVGIVASKLGILPFSGDEIHTAFGQVIASQIGRRGSGETPMAQRAIEAVRGYIDLNQGRFPPLSAYGAESSRAGTVGYRYSRNDGEEFYLFIIESFRKVFVADFGDAIYRYLDASDFLLVSRGRGHQFQVRLPKNGGQKSFIAIKAKICLDAD